MSGAIEENSPAVMAAVSRTGGIIVPAAMTPRVICASAVASMSALTLASNGMDADLQLSVVLKMLPVWLIDTGPNVVELSKVRLLLKSRVDSSV